MEKFNSIIDRLPKHYSRDPQSQIYNILKAFADEFEIVYSEYIERANNAIGIDNTLGQDLDWRWGSLLNISRRVGESDTTYRKRLSRSMSTLHGGTAESIKYAVSIMLGIEDDEIRVNKFIKIYDGWEYDGAEPEMKQYGHIICVIILDTEDSIYYDGIEDDIIQYIENVKAAGTAMHVIVEFIKYSVLSMRTYQQLSERTHDQIRKWG